MVPARDVLALDQQLCFAVYTATRALTRAYAPLLEPLGLTYPQYLTMLVLWEEDGASVKHLGRRLALDSGTLTPVVKRLEQQGLVRRERSKDDERVVNVHLTPKGKTLSAKAKTVPTALACRAGFDAADPEALKRAATLRDALRDLSRRLGTFDDGDGG